MMERVLFAFRNENLGGICNLGAVRHCSILWSNYE